MIIRMCGPMSRRAAAFAMAAATFTAGVAHGQAATDVAPAAQSAVSPGAATARPAARPLLFSMSRSAFGRAYADANPYSGTGVAQTSLDRRFAEDAATGSAGFLCGLQPMPELNSAADARGADPQGRFLGAKLTLAF